jgi:hypothetical protein
MSAICQVSAATAGGNRTGASGRPAGSWLPCAAGVGRGYGRRRVEKGFGKMCALSALSRRPGARGSRWVARGGVGAWSAQAWGSLSGRQTRVLPLGGVVGAVYRMVTCLRSRLRTFPLADSKNIFGVLAPGAGGGLRVRENALNEGHQACRTTKPIDEGFKAFSQLLWSGKSSEVWFSLRENHVNVGGFGLHQLRKCFSTRGTLFYCREG